MDVQPILDATAQIAAGAALGTHPGVYKGAGGIAGVKIGYSSLPDQADLAEQGPAHVSFWDGMPSVRPGASDLTAFDIRIRMQLSIAQGPAILPVTYRLLTPYLALYIAAFAQHVSLLGTCKSAQIVSSPGIVTAIYPGRIALELILLATVKESVAYAL